MRLQKHHREALAVIADEGFQVLSSVSGHSAHFKLTVTNGEHTVKLTISNSPGDRNFLKCIRRNLQRVKRGQTYG